MVSHTSHRHLYNLVHWSSIGYALARTTTSGDAEALVQDEENGEWAMRYEIIRHVWKATVAASDSDLDDEDEFKP